VWPCPFRDYQNLRQSPRCRTSTAPPLQRHLSQMAALWGTLSQPQLQLGPVPEGEASSVAAWHCTCYLQWRCCCVQLKMTPPSPHTRSRSRMLRRRFAIRRSAAGTDALFPTLEKSCQNYTSQTACAAQSQSPAACDWQPIVFQTWGGTGERYHFAPKITLPPKHTWYRIHHGYNGTAVTIPEGYAVSIVTRANGAVLDAGAKGSLFIAEGWLILEGLTRTA